MNMVKINGEERPFEGKNIEEIIGEEGYRAEFVAVEKNGRILPKEEYRACVLEEGDSVEIVRFVGGG